ncbi:hypothetical protein VTN96DRAFT_7708 [Rasamsonia emersonii]|uniref:Uncharacterized protein n=1 Tax=Rasamsonia emersonii (strain ATCC 16479 / CBS 393.64 / IMI 116815) TaxID=1408163 RepID=A0A0F4YY86_RASE3|nr:hypothetical protein T310_2740 [Rasamsonia emersonii CBS 393.64]KKA23247.1 hypothetical protein T310_2740 [Rasamsonia emersonii CBS 393.64]
MHTTTLLLLLTSLASVSLASTTTNNAGNGNWWCSLAKDEGFPQKPYCCDDSRVEQWPNGMTVADSCTPAPEAKQPCPQANDVWCCYVLDDNNKWGCTSVAEWKT